MAANKHGSEHKNPFSFTSFVTKKGNTSSNDISELNKIDRKEEFRETSTTDNPFSFKKFVKPENKPDSASRLPELNDYSSLRDEEHNYGHLNVTGGHFTDSKCKRGTESDSTTEQSCQLNNILPEFSQEQGNIHLSSQTVPRARAHNSSKLFDSDSDSESDSFEDAKTEKRKESAQTVLRTDAIPSSDSSDSDDFSPQPRTYKPKVLQDINDVPMQAVILEDLNGLSRTELIRKIEKLREENKNLLSKIKTSEDTSKEHSARVTQLEAELKSVRKKESEETAALENIIQQVEANLKISTERAVEAEKCVKQCKQEVKALQGTVKSLRTENEQLRSRGHAHPGASGEQLKFVSDQLKTAATNAEHSLKQLLGGVENLKLMSQTLVSMDKFHEVPGDHSSQ